MDFSELAIAARSHRRFLEDRPVSGEALLSIIETAGLAPCASNLQRLRYSLVTEPRLRETLFPSLGWAGYLKDWSGPVKGERPSAYIIIHTPVEDRPFTGIDVGIAASYLILAAADMGIAGCMLLSFNGGIVDAVAPAPGYRPALVIALGFPGEKVVLERNSAKAEYWRDGAGVHHVPKLPTDTLILKG
jgi:nitroreductase